MLQQATGSSWLICLGILIVLFAQGAGPATAQSRGVQVELRATGLQALSHNGQNYLTRPTSDQFSIISDAEFIAPDGTIRSYGGAKGSLDAAAFKISKAVRSVSVAKTSFEHTYRLGEADSVTVQVSYTPLDARTLKIDTTIRNNSPTNLLSGIRFGSAFLNLTLPGAANQYGGQLPIDIGPLNLWARSPAAFFSGPWGSLALWMGDYTGTQDVFAFYHAPDQTAFNFQMSSYSVNSAGQSYAEPVAPNATKTLTLYLRFGTPSDTAMSLAPEAYVLARKAYPSLVNWTDKRPIARLFISGQPTAHNPRGYLSDPTLDVTNHRLFAAKVRAWMKNVLQQINAMFPKPQGILLWDLEGQEFRHTFTYVGSPNSLSQLAPEMDAVADEVFGEFRNAGYKIGMTLRPSSFLMGTILPPRCRNDVNPGSLKSFPAASQEIFVKTDGIPPFRGYECRSADTWVQAGARLPSYQTMYNDEDKVLSILKEKVGYAQRRWGATMFYVDSTVNTKGDPLNYKIFRRLQEEYPDVLFVLENANTYYYGTAATYGQGNMGAFDVPDVARVIYPNAFRVLQMSDSVNYQDPAVHERLVQSVKNGNILLVDGWSSSGNSAAILQVYRDAGFVR